LVDHDRLFKQLLSTFLLEFLQLFAPELAEEVEPGSVEFLDKETFTDAVAGDHHIVDLLARVRVRGHPGCVLVHVEPQARENDIRKFPRRMFRYFAGLEARHPDVPIYPMAVLSFDRPPQPDSYTMDLPGLKVLEFRFRQVQLNQLSWREYIRHHNPVAAAFMSCMRIEPNDRWRVKLACTRLLFRLRLDPAKTRLVLVFVDTYLNLDSRERRLLIRELKAMPVEEGDYALELWNARREEARTKGRAEGRAKGLEEGRRRMATIVLSQLRRHVGTIPEALGARVQTLPIDRLEELGVDLLDFTAPADLERWLHAHD
jgi:hypothetical protein